MALKIILSFVALAALCGVIYFTVYYFSMRNIKEPSYTVLQKSGAIEIRHYAPMLIAEVRVSGNADESISQGFRILANYIFGNNIAMTAPVTQEKSEKIAMSVPVMQKQDSDAQWIIAFAMPKHYTLETLPKPQDPRVQIKAFPERQMIAIRFSGIRSEALIEKKRKELQAYIAKHKLHTTGEPTAAYYNPPSTLPMLRRNEILLKLHVPGQ